MRMACGPALSCVCTSIRLTLSGVTLSPTSSPSSHSRTPSSALSWKRYAPSTGAVSVPVQRTENGAGHGSCSGQAKSSSGSTRVKTGSPSHSSPAKYSPRSPWAGASTVKKTLGGTGSGLGLARPQPAQHDDGVGARLCLLHGQGVQTLAQEARPVHGWPSSQSWPGPSIAKSYWPLAGICSEPNQTAVASSPACWARSGGQAKRGAPS